MAYEAVPIDVEIQKLTAAERDALSRYKIHENINTFLGNEGTPKLIAGAALLASLPKLLSIIIPILAKQIPEIPPDVAEAIDTGKFILDLQEALNEIILPGGGILFKGETLDFYDKYVKK